MVVKTRNKNNGEPVTEQGATHRARPQLCEDGRGADAPLVHLPQSSAAFVEVLDDKTGEIQRFSASGKRREYVQISDEKTAISDARARRFALQTQARKLLQDRLNPRGSGWRVVDCYRKRIADHVAVLKSPLYKRASFGNLKICGSVWTCPVCAAKVAERRKAEIEAATATHKAAGGGLYMLTLTFAHGREDQIAVLVERLRSGLVWFRKHRQYKKLLQYVDFVGLVRALEVKFSERNGWHPHIHELWFVRRPLSRAALRVLKSALFDLWHSACAAAGLGLPNRRHGVDIVAADSVADYVAKFDRLPRWGVAAELTRAHSKRSLGSESFTPFDLLALSEVSERAASLFIAFAEAFFGSRQLFWSPGLKAAFGIDDFSDDELAQAQDEAAQLITRIPAIEWRALLALPFDARCLVLSAAESGGHDAVRLFISGVLSPRVCATG